MLKYNNEQIIHWMDGIRENPDMVNCFWASQIHSKEWLCDWVKSYLPSANRIIVFGSWYGVLADMLQIKLPNSQIMCVDKDHKPLLWSAKKHAYWLGEMQYFEYETNVDLVINTSTEHMTQWEYDTWYNNIPVNTYFVVQGNNDSREKDPVRRCNGVTEFREKPNIVNCLHSGVLEYEGPWDKIENRPTVYERYMAIGFKDKNDRKDRSN